MIHLSFREKKALVILSVFLVFFLVLYLIVLPALEKRKNLEARIMAKTSAVEELMVLEQRFHELENRFFPGPSVSVDHDPDFSLFSFLEKLAEQCGIKENVAYMKPFTRRSETGNTSLSMVRLKIESLFLDQLVDFLKGIETSGRHVYIKSMSLSRTGDVKKRMDAVIETETVI